MCSVCSRVYAGVAERTGIIGSHGSVCLRNEQSLRKRLARHFVPRGVPIDCYSAVRIDLLGHADGPSLVRECVFAFAYDESRNCGSCRLVNR
jgi:hypothetical protein